VTARDSVGHGATSTVNWVVDHTAPAVPVVVGPTSPTNATSASVVFSDSATDVASYTCVLDTAAAVTCTSPWSIAGPVAEGSHTVTVNAIDGSGNARAARRKWIVDNHSSDGTLHPERPGFTDQPERRGLRRR